MIFKGFTNRCKKIINQYTYFEAKRFRHKTVQPEHILIALLKEGQSNAYTVLSEVIDLVHFQFILESHVSKMKDDTAAGHTDIFLYYNLQITCDISERTKAVLGNALEEAKKIGAVHLDTFAIFLACCEEENSIAHAIIMRHELILDDIRKQYYRYIQSKNKKNETNVKGDGLIEKDDALPEIKNVRFYKLIEELNDTERPVNPNLNTEHTQSKKTIHEDSKDEKEQHPFSSSRYSTEHEKTMPKPKGFPEYLQNLSQLAKEDKLSPIFGREKEIKQLLRILLRKQKNNPILVGDPGVGKTAIVEELALRIFKGQVPLPLLNAEIIRLDLALLTAGTRYRGDFEEKILVILQEFQALKDKNKHPILYIDEFHHIIGAGLAANLSMDAAGILKPALARGELSCIGITTAEEYRKYVETDKAFQRRLQRVNISEMSQEDTFQTLQKIKVHYEHLHHVCYQDEALKEIIRLAEKYICDRFFPDKAVDLLDEVGAYNRLHTSDTPPELSLLYSQEAQYKKEVAKIIHKFKFDKKHVLYEKYQKTSDELQSVIERKQKLQTKLINNISNERTSVTPADVRKVVSISTEIPTDRLNSNHQHIIKTLEKNLNIQVVGQSHAIHSLVSVVKRSAVGLHQGNRPLGSFIFLGPTGVGKTHTAKQFAKFLLGSDTAITRFDMSDFVDVSSVNKLIGAPPGYVGYDESGLLIKLMRHNPRQLLLFDEIEKAHSRVFDIFLQILEEGTLQGHNGDFANFRHSIIVMTSNIGSNELFSKFNIGFDAPEDNKTRVKNIIGDELTKHFRPEFINRFDEIVVFNTLGQKEILKIIDLLCQELMQKMMRQDLVINISEKAKKCIYNNYFDSQYGARSIRRGMRNIENMIADVLIDNENSDKVLLDVDHNKLKIIVSETNTQDTKKKKLTRKVKNQIIV